MRVGIHQPNYIPWLGYFRKIAQSDTFVFFDNVQMPGGKSYVSRNEINTPKGRMWLTVPVSDKGEGTIIANARITDQRWPRKHLKSLEINYAASSWKAIVRDELAPVMETGHVCIADLNIALIERIARLIGLDEVDFIRATDLDLTSGGAESVSEILDHLGASEYLTGAGAGSMRHLDVDALEARGVATQFVSSDFSPYQQYYGDFEANLSIIDTILSIGPEGARGQIDAIG